MSDAPPTHGFDDGALRAPPASASAAPQDHASTGPDAPVQTIQTWADGDDEVHQAVHCGQPDEYSRAMWAGFVGGGVGIYFAVAAIPVALWMMAARFFRLPPYILFALPIGLLLVFAVFGVRKLIRHVIESSKWRREAHTADLSRRVIIVGTLAAREKIGQDLAREETQHGDAPFEPVIVYALTGHRPIAASVAGILVGFVVVFAFQAFFVEKFWMHVNYLHFLIAAGVGELIGALIIPVYYRVTPGRVDVMAYPLLGAGKPSVTAYDLKRCQLIVRAGWMRASIVDPTRPGRAVTERMKRYTARYTVKTPGGGTKSPEYFASATLSYAVFGRREFALALLRAATTKHATPPLPDDRLI